jgi:hypothetical protein
LCKFLYTEIEFLLHRSLITRGTLHDATGLHDVNSTYTLTFAHWIDHCATVSHEVTLTWPCTARVHEACSAYQRWPGRRVSSCTHVNPANRVKVASSSHRHQMLHGEHALGGQYHWRSGARACTGYRPGGSTVCSQTRALARTDGDTSNHTCIHAETLRMPSATDSSAICHVLIELGQPQRAPIQ